MVRRGIWVAAVWLLAGAGIAAASPLDALQWRHRVVLLFAPSADDPLLRAAREELARAACEARERDIVVVEAVAGEPLRIDGKPAGDAGELRGRYGIPNERFAALLIGKDGGVKRRDDSAPDLAGLFAQIDAMPMRRQEAAARGGVFRKGLSRPAGAHARPLARRRFLIPVCRPPIGHRSPRHLLGCSATVRWCSEQ
jgi:hypothetical protein